MHEALLDVTRGAIVAPAGCGKTQLIADAVVAASAARPILVLTHTNAGVAALRARFKRAAARSQSYRVATIDGWAMRLASHFPIRSDLRREALDLRHPRTDYPEIRDAALRLLEGGHVASLLRSTYDRILVDEYQDCNETQHALVTCASEALSTVILGDPLQAIFGFGGIGLPKWDSEVCARFPVITTLDTPWRWLNAGADGLGRWLLEIREPLRAGRGVDLTLAPDGVKWVQLSGDNRLDRRLQLQAARTELPGQTTTALILADSRSPSQQRTFASQLPGAATVEAVDLRDFVAFADELDTSGTGEAVLELVVSFASVIMTNVGAAELRQRVATLRREAARLPPSATESAALGVFLNPSAEMIAGLLEALNRQAGVHVYRPAVLRACFAMVSACRTKPTLTFGEAARRIRDDVRGGHRAVAQRAVGSTLLLKGLEADIAVLLDAGPMNSAHLYVAMTRGARLLVVCSTGAVLNG